MQLGNGFTFQSKWPDHFNNRYTTAMMQKQTLLTEWFTTLLTLLQAIKVVCVSLASTVVEGLTAADGAVVGVAQYSLIARSHFCRQVAYIFALTCSTTNSYQTTFTPCCKAHFIPGSLRIVLMTADLCDPFPEFRIINNNYTCLWHKHNKCG